ncbi:hypothetical protein Aab01nite_58070 [Paractinoplanes abujensis]|nr:hypothetical protein Aab01nite_58070 [Actinoplanes abujensis]
MLPGLHAAPAQGLQGLLHQALIRREGYPAGPVTGVVTEAHNPVTGDLVGVARVGIPAPA